MTILRSTGPVISTRRHCSAGGQRRDLPVAVADGARLGRKSGRSPASSRFGALDARGQQLLAARLERAVQLGDERQRRRREDGLEAGMDRAR